MSRKTKPWFGSGRLPGPVTIPLPGFSLSGRVTAMGKHVKERRSILDGPRRISILGVRFTFGHDECQQLAGINFRQRFMVAVSWHRGTRFHVRYNAAIMAYRADRLQEALTMAAMSRMTHDGIPGSAGAVIIDPSALGPGPGPGTGWPV